MDISETTAPRSDQQNYDDYATASKTVTISEVRKGSTEQPVEIHLTEFPGRPFKPSKSMRRVLVAAWGADASVYVGRKITLYGDPSIRFGKESVGGIRIAALSDIDQPLTVSLTVTRGRRAPFTVQPLATPTDSRDWLKELADTGGDADLISALGVAAKTAGASPDVLNVIRKAYNDAREGS